MVGETFHKKKVRNRRFDLHVQKQPKRSITSKGKESLKKYAGVPLFRYN